MIDDQFIFAKQGGSLLPKIKTQVHTNHIVTKAVKKIKQDQSQQTILGQEDKDIQNELAVEDQRRQNDITQRLQLAEQKFHALQAEVCPLDDIGDMQLNIDKQLIQLQAGIDRLNAVVEFEKDVDFGTESSVKIAETYVPKQAYNDGFFDMEGIQSMIKSPAKRSDMSQLAEKYDHEHEYLATLNLRQIVIDVFKTLEKSLSKANQFTGEGGFGIEFNYDLLQSATQQRDYLDQFSGRFMRFMNQLLAMGEYVKGKEAVHIQQIQSLTEQNQVLFEENCTLHKQLVVLNQQSQSSLFPLGKTDTQKLTIKEQKRIVKELVMMHREKLETIKCQISNGSFSVTYSGPVPTLKSIPLEDPKIYALINSNFDLLDQLKDIVRQRIDESKVTEEKQRTRIANIMSNYNVFKQVFDSLVKKQLPRCKAILKVDAEYIRSTIGAQKEQIDQAIKKHAGDEIPQMNVLNVLKCHEQMISKIDSLLVQVL